MNIRILPGISAIVLSCLISTNMVAQTASGLVHKWSGNGNGLDSAGSADCLTANLSFTTGQSGQAFNFDGTVLPDFGSNVCIFGSDNFTIDFWIKTTQTDTATVFSRRAWCSADNVAECAIAAGTVTFQLSKSDQLNCTVQSAKTINDGTFHHVALVRRSTALSLYIDGVMDAQSTASQVISITKISSGLDQNANVITDQPDFLLGAGPCTTKFNGALDEIEVYDRALDDTEVYWLVHPGAPVAIIDQPFNQRTLVGRSVVFHVAVVGLQPITYQWRFNGHDIPGAISNNLVIATPLVSDSGSYYVVIDNPAGQVSSREATLVVTNLSTPSDALMARWSGEGTAMDSIGGNNGTMQNVQFAPGVLGTSFKFNGHGEVDCPNPLAGISTNDFTIDFWMLTKTTGLPLGPTANFSTAVLGQRTGCIGTWDTACFRCGVFVPPFGGASNSFVTFNLGTGHVPFYPDGSLPPSWPSYVPLECAPDTSSSSIQINDGVFHHVAGVRQGQTVSIYLDGRFVQRATTRETVNYCPRPQDFDRLPFQLGADRCDNFTGQLDEVQVHSRALTDSEIYSEYSPDPTLVILRQSLGVDVLEGNDTSLSVSVAGLPPYTYQWQHNGNDISGATDSSYTIATAALTDAGSYSVVIGNALQTLTSLQTSLSVIATNSTLPGLLNMWTGDGNANDCVGHAEIRTFNAVYATGITGRAFDLGERGGTFDEQTGNFGTNDFTISVWVKSLLWNHYFEGGFDGGPLTTNGPSPSDPPPAPLYEVGVPNVMNIISKNEPELDRFWAGFALRLTNGAVQFCGADADGHIFSAANAAPPIYLYMNPDAHLYYYGHGLLDDTNFHHIAAVRRATTNIELYLDGTLVAQTNLPVLTTLDNTSSFAFNNRVSKLMIGTNGLTVGSEYCEFFNGRLDQLEFYNRALAPSEITSLYQRYSNNPQVNGALQRIESHAGDVLTLKPDRIAGPGPFTYQWTLNGVAIAGATNSTLAVTVDANSGGDYDLVVSNAYGSVTCPTASVTLALAVGSYNGLFYLDGDSTDDASGYVTLTVTSSQTFSGKIVQHTKHYPFTGRFSAGHAVSPSISRPGKSLLTLNFTMPTAAGLDQITGVVSDGQHVSPLTARRAVYGGASPTPQAGKYTIAFEGIPSATAPNGHGLGNITISANGSICVGASLSDGTPVTQGSMVANSGEWPFYVSMYGGKGSMLGWLSFTNAPGSRCVGQLRWIKPPGAPGKNYTSGFATTVPVTASKFAPASSGLGINLDNYELVMDGAKIYSAVSNDLTAVSGNAIQFSQTNAPLGTLTAKPTTGQFSGTFIHPVTKVRTPIKGIVLQEQGEAAGYFISGKLSGRVVLKPK